MNKDILKGALVGAITTGVGVFFAVKEYYSAKSDKEFEEIRASYIDDINRLKSEIKELKKELAKENLKNNDPIDISEESNDAADVQESEHEEVEENEYQKASERIQHDQYEQTLKEDQKYKYSNISEQNKPKKKAEKPVNKPYIITPEHFHEEPNFFKTTLDYWAGNGVFTNIDGGVEEEAGVWVDIQNNISRFGDYEDNMLYIRNDKENTDYEIYWHDEEYHDGDLE